MITTTHDADDAIDHRLVERTFDTLAVPPSTPADSFVLHAPLELMARAELLPAVDPTARDVARGRIEGIAREWASRAPHVTRPPAGAGAPLAEAVAAGDVDAADRAVVELAGRLTVDEIVAAAASSLLGYLGGAGHLAIFLDQISRVPRAPRSALVSSRALIRDLASHPDWRIEWIDAGDHGEGRAPRSFLEVLADPPSAGDPGSDFIYPTMHLVDRTGMAAELLAAPVGTVSLGEAQQQLLRVAAMSMLQDDPRRAPYGWSHCLTMPQAALAIAPRTPDPRRVIAVAATYVLGFRATQSSRGVDLDWRPARPVSHRPLLECEVDEAVATAWHASDPATVEGELATYAATHHDAHLAKYTRACFRAAMDDPEAAPLFRAAAARLALWWRDEGGGASVEAPDGAV